MKKTKFVSGLLSAVLVLSAFAVPAAAADVTSTNSGGTATVSYTNDSVWTATIPAYVAPVEAGQQDVSAYEVTVKDVVIGENQQLAATIEYSGYVTEANGVKIPYQLYDSAGKEIQSGDTILSKSAGEPGTEATITFGAALTDSPKYAGVYTDTATFVFTAKDKAYSQEEIDADDHIFGIGYHESKDVIAIFNDDFTEVVIQENGDCQYNKGKMMGFTSPSSSYNTRQSPMTTHGDTLKKVIIKDGVTSVGNSAFENCSLLTSENISFPASVTSVGEYSFKSCLGLTDLSFLNQVAQIGVQAFSSCSNITDVVLSDNVVSVKSAAFTKCLSLKSAKLSPNMTEVASGLFNGCVALKPVTSVDTSSEALAVSMSEKACVDMEYMCELSGKTEEEIFADLKGVIFLNPMYGDGDNAEAKYLMSDEYLSGNVREKLALAKSFAESDPENYAANVEALEKVQPKDLPASEIAVRLGTTWIPLEIFQQFIFEFLGTPRYAQWNIKLQFSQFTNTWSIAGKSYDQGNVKAYSTYGTKRINAYKIIEETLNLKDVRIFDYVEDADGKKKAVLNKKETAIALSKQELIKQGFQDWVWTDPARRERLCKIYNEMYNSSRPREYDGRHLTFPGMNPEIELREHQKNAVAHMLYGGNTLLAHTVGAGKTFEIVAAVMEAKRLGLFSKAMIVVPNHLTEQWATEFLLLYPAANILVATKKDFETKNRKKFCGRIATGDYDAIIIGHSQFEKIPMSIERQRQTLNQQLDEIITSIAEEKRRNGNSFSVKQLERTRKSVQLKLDKLNDQSQKDDVVTFEELGVDRIFIDESHYFKNLFLYTKMRNVGGIAQTEAQKSSDLFMKCRYLDELTGSRGVVFATGTPISNSMVELYTIQRYLQYDTLVKHHLQHFDAWASTFGETISAVELTPEGSGYRAKTRFARFYNLPELMAMFKEVADIKTADMLNLPVPKAIFHNISVKPSEIQKQMVAELAERAEKVRNGLVDATEDNMLKITNDGRKLALDQRLINPLLPDFEGSKLNACVDTMFETWEKGKEKRLTQLFFCDLSTPKGDGSFSVYDDIRQKLIERGVPPEEIKFIHEADTEAKKQELFKKVCNGDVRILMGSTQKMGAGTNVQNKLAASIDLDCPWRPSDLEQRLGRSIRQGNENKEVDIYRFVTEGTFDAYLYQLVESKQQKFRHGTTLRPSATKIAGTGISQRPYRT